MDLINLALLRDVLSSIIIEHGVALTHSKIPLFCTELGLLSPDEIGTKRDRMTTSFNALSNSDLPKVAERLLTSYPPNAAIRIHIQNIL